MKREELLARKKQKDMDSKSIEAVEYYWCVSCGEHGKFKMPRFRSAKCEYCGYDDLLALSKEEFDQLAKERPWMNQGITYKQWEEENEKRK
jgi:hypothetical protein